jgi:hypothetical protein
MYEHVQLGINSTRDVWKFLNNFQTSLVLLIPNCARHRMITYTYSVIYHLKYLLAYDD